MFSLWIMILLFAGFLIYTVIGMSKSKTFNDESADFEYALLINDCETAHTEYQVLKKKFPKEMKEIEFDYDACLHFAKQQQEKENNSNNENDESKSDSSFLKD